MSDGPIPDAPASAKRKGNGCWKNKFITAPPALEVRSREGGSEKARAPKCNARRRSTDQEAMGKVIAALVEEDSAHNERMRKIIAESDPNLYSSANSQAPFEIWAPTYDSDMMAHQTAIDALVKMAAELQRIGLGDGKKPIFGRKELELSCGTGTVIKLICDNLPPEFAKSARFTANDLSQKMKKVARDKLRDTCHVTWTGHDLRRLSLPNGAFHTAILSQTAHLITDPALLVMERDGEIEAGDHRSVKREVIGRASELLAEGGYFVFIDEFPAKLSDRNLTGRRALIEKRFNDTFRKIDNRETFHEYIMGNVPLLKFRAALKARIDRDHTMYLEIYERDPDKARRLILPADLPEAIGARREAVDRMIRAFEAMDQYFINTAYVPINGEKQRWNKLIPASEGPLFDSRGRLDAFDVPGKYGTIVISQCLHVLDDTERLHVLGKAVDTLKVGGSLIVIDEWPPPAGSVHALEKRSFRSKVMENFQDRIIFQATLNLNILPGYNSSMMGHHFRKIG